MDDRLSPEQVLARIVHDLKSPLRLILHSAQAAVRGERDSAATMTEIEELAEIAVCLLETTSVAVHRERPRFAAMKASQLNMLVQETVALSKDKARSKELRFNVDLQHSGSPAVIDSRLVSIALSHAISNAVAYSRRRSTILVTSSTKDDRLVLTVENVSAIPLPTPISRAFEPWVRGDEAFRLSGGVGLGLSVAKQIVDWHGGEIELSELGGGFVRLLIRVPLLRDGTGALP